jgi:hypothetical protein
MNQLWAAKDELELNELIEAWADELGAKPGHLYREIAKALIPIRTDHAGRRLIGKADVLAFAQAQKIPAPTWWAEPGIVTLMRWFGDAVMAKGYTVVTPGPLLAPPIKRKTWPTTKERERVIAAIKEDLAAGNITLDELKAGAGRGKVESLVELYNTSTSTYLRARKAFVSH